MQIKVQPIEKIHFEEVLELLKNISEYAPPKNSYSTIWKNFINQENNYALVALFNNKVVGFGVVVVETKIRGGRQGHIEDIVTDPNMQKNENNRTNKNDSPSAVLGHSGPGIKILLTAELD